MSNTNNQQLKTTQKISRMNNNQRNSSIKMLSYNNCTRVIGEEHESLVEEKLRS